VKNFFLFIFLLTLAACTAEPTPTAVPTLPPAPTPETPAEKVWPATVAELPAGDSARGEEFYSTKACAACHGQVADQSSALVGPWLGNYAERAAGRREGYTADSYLYESILNPNAHISPDCPTGTCLSPSAMPPNQSIALEIQELADIMAYLLQKESFEGTTEIEQLK
jgi:mono/diheme cytochrome c family protein